MKEIFAFILFCTVTISCTDLDAPVYESVNNFWQTEEQIEQGVAKAYVQLRGYVPTFFDGVPNVYDLHEMSSDEIIVPNRGTDWNDGAIWEELWKHTWTSRSLSVSDGWQFIFDGVATTNQIIESLENLKKPPVDIVPLVAELRTLRAFYYYQALDLFGNVPLVTKRFVDASEAGTRTRAEVFAFVENEIKASLPNLTGDVSVATYGRATRWFAYTLLAKLYLNAEVYIGLSLYRECIEACDAVIGSNKYVLEPNFFRNFVVANEDSKENIFSIPFDQTAGMEFFMVQGFSLHYNSGATFGLESGGFNGFCTTAEYLRLFDEMDIRKKMFLVGQQYINQIEDEDHLQFDRSGDNLLIFDPVITKFHIDPPKTETAGARCAKWEFNRSGWGNMSNDFAVYRLADVILMKTEAQLRNGDMDGALQTINQEFGGVSIRSRTGLPDYTASEMTLDGLLAERARELSWEGYRRNDLIRFGHFLDARIPEKGVSESFRALFPIPQNELEKNEYLKQNSGY